MKLTLARPEHARHISQFLRSVHGDEFPHPELFDGDIVERLLLDDELAVVLASGGRQIVGAGIGLPQTYNQVLEIGSLSVDDVPDRTEIAKALFEAVRRYGIRQFGIAYFRARSEAAFRRGREIGATCWGFRPMPGSKSIDDCELMMGFFAEDAALPRIKGPRNSIAALPFARRISEALPAQETDIPYPKQFPVGAPRGTGTPVISGRVWPTYNSAGNYVIIESSAGPYPIEIIREFVGKIRQKGVADIRLALPVNHEAAFLDLVDFGFTPVAYLPGWHLKGTHRFDCIELVSGLPRVPRNPTTFVERAVRRIVDELSPR